MRQRARIVPAIRAFFVPAQKLHILRGGLAQAGCDQRLMEDKFPNMSPARAAALRPTFGRLPGLFFDARPARIGRLDKELPDRLRTDGWWLDQPGGWLTDRLSNLDASEG